MNPDAALTPDTAYEFEVLAGPGGILDNSANELVSGTVVSFTTSPPAPPVLGTITASAASAGNVVVLSGSGFSSIPSENEIVFQNKTVNPSDSDPGALTVTVPVQAQSGDVHVVVGGSQTTNTLPFR